MKYLPIFGTVGPVALEMEVHAAAAQLGAQISKGQQLICPQQNVHGLCSIGDRLDDVQLIRQPAPGSNPGKMLGLVDEYDRRAAMTQCLFGGIAQFHAAQIDVAALIARVQRASRILELMRGSFIAASKRLK